MECLAPPKNVPTGKLKKLNKKNSKNCGMSED